MLTSAMIKEAARKAGADMCGIGPISRMAGAPDEMNPKFLFPEAKSRTYPSVMARLNDPRLFSKLFNCEVRTIQEAYRVSSRPLLMNESI